MAKKVWDSIDFFGRVFSPVFFRVCFQIAVVSFVGAIIYICVLALPHGLPALFRTLFIFFGSLYLLFSLFSFMCLVTKFQSIRVLPPRKSNDAHANVLYKALWSVEAFVGIDGFALKDRYRYWSFMHYLAAVMMFVNATYCLSMHGSMLPPKSAFNNLDPVENVWYTFDLLHKSVISEAQSHFEKHISKLPHTFPEINFESIYFFSFKIISALLLISVLAMLFEPSFSRARTRRRKD